MKNSLLLFNDGKENFFAEYLSSITRLFKRAGFEFSTVEILSPSDDLAFKNTFSRLMLRSDNLVVVGEGVDFDLKNIVAEATNSTLLENENAKSFLDAVRKSSGIDFSDDNALIPLEATVIPNLEGAYQGFMLDNQEFTLAVLPSDLKQFLLSADKYFIPFLEEKYSLNRKRMTLKYVGSEKKLIEVLEEAKLMSDQNFKYEIEENFGDYKIDLTFDKKGSIDNCPSVRYVIEKLGSDIYAEYDVSLSERLFDVLKLKNLTLSVAESFTGGRLAQEIVKNSGASTVFKEGIVCYSNESKMSRLGVEKAKLISDGAVSSTVAYQMALGLIRTGVDVGISTTGIAGPKSDDTQKPVGLCYVAIGLKNGIHTYKLNLNGDRGRITETAKNTALFLAIKNLKNL